MPDLISNGEHGHELVPSEHDTAATEPVAGAVSSEVVPAVLAPAAHELPTTPITPSNEVPREAPTPHPGEALTPVAQAPVSELPPIPHAEGMPPVTEAPRTPDAASIAHSEGKEAPLPQAIRPLSQAQVPAMSSVPTNPPEVHSPNATTPRAEGEPSLQQLHHSTSPIGKLLGWIKGSSHPAEAAMHIDQEIQEGRRESTPQE